MKKFLLVLFSLLIIASGGYYFYLEIFNKGEDTWICKDGNWIKHGSPKEEKPSIDCRQQLLVGGDEDKHGCKPSAGYTWCEPKEKCLRTWEEPCEIINNATLSTLISSLEESLVYPSGWKTEITDKKPKDCEQLDLYSKNYKLNDGYPILERGAYVMVRVCETEETDIEKSFEKDVLDKNVIENIESIKAAGVNAFQYDYSFEGWNATDTLFIKDGIYYTIKLRYVNDDG